MLTGGANFNTTDTMVGHVEDIIAKRDAILSAQKLDPYARARIYGRKTPYLAVQQVCPKVAPAPPPRQERPVARYFGLPEIGVVVCAAWGTTMGRMRDLRATPWHKYAVYGFGDLARKFSIHSYDDIADYLWRKSSRSAYQWEDASKRLYREVPFYRLRYDAAKRALESLK